MALINEDTQFQSSLSSMHLPTSPTGFPVDVFAFNVIQVKVGDHAKRLFGQIRSKDNRCDLTSDLQYYSSLVVSACAKQPRHQPVEAPIYESRPASSRNPLKKVRLANTIKIVHHGTSSILLYESVEFTAPGSPSSWAIWLTAATSSDDAFASSTHIRFEDSCSVIEAHLGVAPIISPKSPSVSRSRDRISALIFSRGRNGCGL